MKFIKFNRLLPIVFLILLVGPKILAQVPSGYLCSVRNDTLLTSKIYEFDIYLQNTDPVNIFELGTFQAGIIVNSSVVNGGTITASIVAGSSQLVVAQQPLSVSFAFTTVHFIRVVARTGPGLGLGTIISNSSPGTRVLRIRLTNTADFGQFSPNFSFNFTPTPYNTVVSAYNQSTGLNTNITLAANHTVATMYNPVFNSPLATFNVTGSGSAPSAVGLDGSQLVGVNYILYQGVSTIGNAVNGSGSAISFGSKPEGTYTVKAHRRATYMYSDMAGSAIVGAAAPTAFSVTGTGSYCQGLGGLPVGLTDSETGVTYTLIKGGVPTSTIASGTGSTITFGNQLAGTYTVSGTNGGGTTAMIGSAVITESPAPSAPTGSITQEFCSTTLPIVANLAATGTAIKWYIASVGGTAIATSTTLATGHYFASQTVDGCESQARFEVTATVYATPTPATVGSTQNLCGTLTSASLGGNSPGTGSGAWSQISGPGTTTFSAPTTGTSTATATLYGTYVYRWTISNGTCTASTANVTVNYYATPTPATVGSTQNLCGTLTSASLGGNSPGVGSGSWSQISGPGTTTFSAPTTGASTATATLYGTYVYRWTISNGTCTASNANVPVNYYATPTPATVGSTQNLCGTLTSASLGGNTPGAGSGSWSQISGPGTTTFSAPTTGTSSATATLYGTYVYRWTISNGTCTANTADVTVNYYATPTPATVGSTQNICGTLTSASLGGNNPGVGTGLWSQSAGPGTTTFSAPSSGSSTATATAYGIYTYVWTISNGTCTASTASVTVSYYVTPTPATVGSTQSLCGTLTSASLGGNSPGIGSGSWSQISGLGTTTFSAPTTGTSTATATLYGTYVYRWTISSGTCTASTADVTVNYYATPTPATVGSTQNICGTLTSASLGGNNPGVGTGLWSQSAGPGTTTFSATSSGSSTATATAYGIYTYVWTISNGTCTASTASVTVNYYATPTPATVGSAQNICGTLTSASLGGNSPGVGTGAWSQISGSGTTTFSAPTTGTSTATATIYGTYVYRWTISNGTCTASTADVTVNYYATPTPATVGSAQNLCGTLTSTSLSGNTPGVGSGAWSQISGSGTTTFSASTSGTSTATATLYGTYVYRWTISSGTCTASTADVTVNYYATPTPATVGSTQNICGTLTSASLGGNNPGVGSGAWSQISGSGTTTFSASTSGASTATATLYGTYVYRWTISNGTCTASTANVTVNYYTLPTSSITGVLNACGTTTLTALTDAASPSYVWYKDNVVIPSQTSSTLVVTVSGAYKVKVTNGSTTCEQTTGSSTVTINPTPNVSNQTTSIQTGNQFFVTPIGVPSGTNYTWTAPTVTGTVSGGSAQPAIQSNISGFLTGIGTATYVVTPITGACTGSTFNVTVTVTSTCNPVTIITNPTDKSMCSSTGSTIFTVVAGQTSPFTYQWQYYNGSTWQNVANGFPAGAVYANGNTSELSVSGIASPGNYQYRCLITNCSGTNSITSLPAVLTVNSPPTSPLVGAVSQPTCTVSTGSVVLNGLPSAGTWTLVRTPGAIVTTGTGTSTTIDYLASGNTYSYIVTNAAGCISASSAYIVIDPQPSTPSAPSVGIITAPTCTVTTGSVVLSGLPATGSWTLTRLPGAITTSGTGTSTTVSGLTSGSYNYTVTYAGNCVSPASSTIVIPDPPAKPSAPNVGTITHPTCIANTGSVVLTGLPAGSWIINPGNISGTGTSTTISGLIAGTYNYTVTNSIGCTSVLSSNIVINTQPITPTIVITNPPAVCSPSTVNLTASAVTAGSTSGLTYTYWTNASATVLYATPAAAVAGTYYIKGTTTSGCYDIKPVIATVNPLPTANAGTGGNECDLDFIFSAVPSIGTGIWSMTSGPGTAIFTPDANSPTATVTVSAYGTYTFTWTESSNSCSKSSVVTVNFNQQPVANAGTAGSSCGLGFTLAAVPSYGTGTWTKTSGPGTVTFTPNANTPAARATVSLYGNYTFTWTEVNSSCTSSAALNVSYLQVPVANAGIDGSVCNLDYRLNATLWSGTGTGTWTKLNGPGSAVFSPDANQRDAKVTVSQAGTYDFTWTEFNGTCQSSDIVRIIFRSLPAVSAGKDTTICISDNIQLQGTGTGTFSWEPAVMIINPKIKNPVAAPLSTTPFIVTLTDQYGCVNKDTVVIGVKDFPVAYSGPDLVLEYLFGASLVATEPGVNEIGKWSVIDGSGIFANNSSAETTVNGLALGENILLWSVSNGVCPPSNDYLSIKVNDLIIPTLITPNMDGKNDYFVLRGIETLGKTELVIFDRRGAQVYKNTNYDNSWNGVDYNEKPLLDDTYYFVIKSEKGKAFSGYIVVRR